MLFVSGRRRWLVGSQRLSRQYWPHTRGLCRGEIFFLFCAKFVFTDWMITVTLPWFWGEIHSCCVSVVKLSPLTIQTSKVKVTIGGICNSFAFLPWSTLIHQVLVWAYNLHGFTGKVIMGTILFLKWSMEHGKKSCPLSRYNPIYSVDI